MSSELSGESEQTPEPEKVCVAICDECGMTENLRVASNGFLFCPEHGPKSATRTCIECGFSPIKGLRCVDCGGAPGDMAPIADDTVVTEKSNRTLSPVPPCKGCGSTNLIAEAHAEVPATYTDPIGVDGNELVFAHSASGWGENERVKIRCSDCGRQMRTKLWPVEEQRPRRRTR